jgi:hypothetical protein
MGEDSLFMQTTPDPAQFESIELLQRKQTALTVHPPYSLDLALSDFFPFGHVKYCLEGMVFPSPDELLAAIHEIVSVTPKKPRRACSTTGRRDSNGFLRTMITTIHTLEIG